MLARLFLGRHKSYSQNMPEIFRSHYLYDTKYGLQRPRLNLQETYGRHAPSLIDDSAAAAVPTPDFRARPPDS